MILAGNLTINYLCNVNPVRRVTEEFANVRLIGNLKVRILD